jgi:sec-independent protein translocase protein TatA
LEVAVLAGIFGTDSLYVLIIAVVVLFGGSQLPKLARNAGEAMKEFRKAHNEATEASGPLGASSPSGTSQSAPLPLQQVALPPVVSQPNPVAMSAAPTSDERVTLTRAELDALLADREARAKAAPGGQESHN